MDDKIEYEQLPIQFFFSERIKICGAYNLSLNIIPPLFGDKDSKLEIHF